MVIKVTGKNVKILIFQQQRNSRIILTRRSVADVLSVSSRFIYSQDVWVMVPVKLTFLLIMSYCCNIQTSKSAPVSLDICPLFKKSEQFHSSKL